MVSTATRNWQQQGSILELSPEDSNRFRTMQKADKQLQAALKSH